MATFTWTPDFGAQQAIKPRVRRVAFGDGYEQRQGDGINTQPATWELTFAVRDNTETAAIMTFLSTRAGVESFDWTPPGESTALSFVCRDWTRTMDRNNVNSITARFEQVYEL